MPLPKPRKGESEDDFISRCHRELAKEYPDQDQRNAVCFTQWREEKESKLEAWYEIKAEKGAVDVFIYDQIGAFGVSASELVRDLQRHKGQVLNVFINSPGGLAADGVAIFNAFKRHEATVNMTVDGLAASAASVIFQAGTIRTMGEGALLMVHEAHQGAVGDAAYLRKRAEECEITSNQIAGIYAGRAGGTPEEWRERMIAETWYSADEAKEANLADIIAESVPIAADYRGRVFNLADYKNVPESVQKANAANALTGILPDPPSEPDTEPDNTDIEEESMSDLTAVRAVLGLDEEGDPVAAINALKAQATDIATGEKGEANALRRQLQESQSAYLELQAKAAQDVLELKDKFRTTEATYKVQAAVDSGRVLPSDKDIAMDLALNSPAAFDEFAKKQRLDLRERGRMVDDVYAAIEPTAEEVKLGAQQGLTVDDLRREKAREQGITIPA